MDESYFLFIPIILVFIFLFYCLFKGYDNKYWVFLAKEDLKDNLVEK